ncbi:starch phosphorylase [Rubritalea squalenifaciens DSM 18772]|uniref:Starch phosphorylase n=1 Tax=Rubritalea squalenifaciens DSM 18772 TaxID=1123071 RepID=A0A1M6IJE4_9BACT|nr:alpha-glucan family phosphorylase [Rubritalea squalenifaciens]SHJ34581.1 starch phosphorylase [Rubritalea squalenifaciens DSM 18772]
MSYLPKPYQPHYKIASSYKKSVAYFSMEFALDQVLKIYSGGLGFLAGSHMRSAHDLKQNVAGIGILWSYGYYNQVRSESRGMAVAHRRKVYHFLKDTGIKFTIPVHGHHVWVKAYYLPSETFGTAPMFFLTTDIEENDHISRTISYRLYDADELTRIAQYILLGVGGAKLLEELGVDPDVWHLNEAHALSSVFYELKKGGSLKSVRKKFVFTTHTPVEAGNEKTSYDLLKKFTFFSGLDDHTLKKVTGIHGDTFNHTLVALRVSKLANAVSELHGHVARAMWKDAKGVCEISHVTNAQNKKYWVDAKLEAARLEGDYPAIASRKWRLKAKLFDEVANQTGRLFDPDVFTIVWARRFAGYKRADLITRDLESFVKMLERANKPVQVIWAGKPFPTDQGAVNQFNRLCELSNHHKNMAVLVGYELSLSKLLKDGSDVWLNNPIVTREASGTSGMSAAMNGSVNCSTYDGWICEFADHGHNAFIIPEADRSLTDEARDHHDMRGFYQILNTEMLPMYYDQPDQWWKLVHNSMSDVVPFFDSDRMADEYYKKIYLAK